MKFICDKCSAKYSIADEKIRKKVLKIRCKKCSHVIIVRDPQARATQQAASSTSPAGQAASGHPSPAQASVPAAPARATAPHPARTPSSQHAAASPYTANQHQAQAQAQGGVQLDLGSEPQQREERTVIARISADWIRQVREEKKEEPVWFFALHGQPKGPVVLSEVTKHIADGSLQKESLVWCGGWPEWTPAGRVPELQDAFHQPAPHQPAPHQPAAYQPAAPPVTPPPVGAPQNQPFTHSSGPLHTPAPTYQNPQARNVQAPLQADASPHHDAHHDIFGARDNSRTMPSVASPLHMLQQETPTPTQPQTPEPPHKANGGGNAFSSTYSSSPSLTPTSPSNGFHQSPLAARGTSTPQSHLPDIMPLSQTTPGPNQQDVAHEQQAIPAVEFIESGVEEDFFARKSSELLLAGTDSSAEMLELALPPMPYMEEPEEEFDIDDADIIEIRETLKPKWTARLAVIAGLSVIAVLLVLPMLLDSQSSSKINNIPNPPKKSQTDSSQTPLHKLSPEEKRAREALLIQQKGLDRDKPAAPRAGTKRTRRKLGRKRSKRIRRRTRIALKTQDTKSTKQKSIDDLIKKRLNERLRKAGFGDDPMQKKEAVSSSSNIDRKLAQRLYRELTKNNRRVQYCYNLHLKSGDYLGGRLVLSLRISPSGRVTRVRVSPRKFKGLRFTRCLLREIKYKWRFTSFSGEAVWLESPYSLSAQ